MTALQSRKFFMRSLFSVTLLLVLSGCAGPQFKPSRLPGLDTIPDGDPDHQDREVSVGSEVQVTLVSGQVIEGSVKALSWDSITIVPDSAEFSVEPLRIPVEDIVSVRELVYPKNAKGANLTTLTLFVGVVTWVVWTIRRIGRESGSE